MSKTLYVDFRGQGFWAFDVVSGIFLKHLIDVAEPRIADRHEAWLAEAVGHWRFNAICGDCGLFLDENWSPEQVRSVREFAVSACDLLSERREISAEEMSSWSLLDGEGVFPRGYPVVTTDSAIRLGRAIIQLLDGSLPESPQGTWWFFGTEDAPPTLAKRQEAT
jgi:hypothetical protein